MRFVTVVLVFVYCGRVAAKNHYSGCPELSRYKKKTSEDCNSYPPGGIANVKFRNYNQIDVTITFGKDYGRIIQRNGSADKIYYIYKIGNEEICSEKNQHIFSSLNRSKIYEINWSIAAIVEKDKMCQSPFQKVSVSTTEIGSIQIKLSNATVKQANEAATIKWKDSDLTHYYYYIQWKPIGCESEQWMNNTEWKNLETNEITLDFKEYPYSVLYVSYFFANATYRNLKTKDSMLNITSTYIGVPDNEISSEIICQNKKKCHVELENNCYKKKGPKVVLLYDLQPTNTSLIKYANHAPAGLIESTDEISYEFTLPRGMLNFTNYKLKLTPANINNVSNSKNSKEVSFVTDPSAPNLVQNVTFYSSHTMIIVAWNKPPDLPPTGVLEKFIITWECMSLFWCNKRRETMDLETEDGLYLRRLDNLKENEQYHIMIEAKNKNVTETTSTQVYTFSTSYKPSYPEIQEFLNISENFFTVLLSRPLDFKEEYYVFIACFDNINIVESNSSKEKINMKDSSIKMEINGLMSSKQYWVSTQACYSIDQCRDWSPKKSFWTVIVGPQIGDITLNIEKTTEEFFTINLPTIDYKQYSGKWNKYVLGKDNKASGRALNGSEILKEYFNSTNAVQTLSTSKSYPYFKMDGRFVIIPVDKDWTTLTFRPEETGAKMIFATAVVIFTEDDKIATIKVSNYTEVFEAMDSNKTSATHIIIIGVCSVIILSFLIFLYFVKRYRAKKVNTVKGKRVKDNLPKKLLPVPALTFDKAKKHPENNILRNCDLMKAPPLVNPVKRVIFKDHPKDFEESDGVVAEGGYANVEFRQDSAVKDYLMKYINSFPLVENIFKSVPSSMPDLRITCSILEKNRRKNRYTNNLAYDETRVILPTTEGDAFSDYINANYIDSPFRQKCFIATQGPKEVNVDTLNDFIRMVWFTQPSHIIMIANLVEKGKKKVAQYWPDDDAPVWFGDILVTLQSAVEKKNFVIRVLKLQYQDQEMQVIQYQFTTWPDHGVPSHTYRFSQLTQRILRETIATNPIIVHCSAGIGRTGTLILTLVVLNQLEAGGYVDFHQALILLRKGRPKLVENPLQFYFAHQLVFDIVTSMEKSIALVDYPYELQVLSPVIREEYEEIQRIRWSITEYQFDFASNPLLAHLNRDQYILPADTNVVYLAGLDFPVTEQYINAVRVSSDDSERHYFTAEHPMPHTVSKIWKLIYEYEVPVVILVNVYNDVDNYPNLVNETEAIYGDVLVTVTRSFCQIDSFESIIEAHVKISYVNEPSVSRSCILIQITDWPHGAQLPQSPNSLIYAARRMICEKERPCLISCGDGVTGCGLIVTLAMIFEYIESGHPINIYKAALDTISDRPEAIISEDQYNYLYDVTGYFIEAMNIKPEERNESRL